MNQRLTIRESGGYWKYNELDQVESHGTGNSKVGLTKDKMVELNNERVTRTQIDEFLKFIEYPYPLDVKILNPVKRNWGKSSTQERWISLRRPSVWVFLHELAHQYLPATISIEEFNQNGQRIILPFIDDCGYMGDHLTDAKIRWGRVMRIAPHGVLFGEILTKLCIAWDAYANNLRDALTMIKRGIRMLHYQASARFWSKKLGISLRKKAPANRPKPEFKSVPEEKVFDQDRVKLFKDIKQIPKKTPAILTPGSGSAKMRCYVAWCQGVVDPETLFSMVSNEVKLASVKAWVRWWGQGKNFPTR